MTKIRTRLFQAWFRLSRPMTLGVRAVIEKDDGRVLLVRHTYTKGLFFPGGGVERGETAHQALRRELEEEAGARFEGNPHLVGVYSNHRVFRNDHVLLYRLGPRDWVPCEATSVGEIRERLWIDPLFPPDDVTPGTRRRLAEIFAGGPNDGHW